MTEKGHLRPYAASSATGCRAPIPAIREERMEPRGFDPTRTFPALILRAVVEVEVRQKPKL